MSELFIRIFLIVMPLYVTNASALFFGGTTPLDFNKKFFDGKPLLGKGKTIEGAIGGITAGTLATAIIQIALRENTAIVSGQYLFVGILLAVGAIAGDAAASFFKRRLGKNRGEAVPLLDQLDFVFGGLVFASPLFLLSLEELLIIVALTVTIHAATNYIAFKLRLKNVPW